MLNIVDDVTRECLAAIPDTSVARRRMAREVTALLERRGKPGMIVSDHGMEFTSECLIEGAQGRVALHRTGKADVRHGYVERCNGRMRDELLNERRLSGILCGGPVSSVEEPLAKDDGELCLCLHPFPRRPFPLLGRVVKNEI
ncbi:hypothetical protein CN934_32930 [Ensifer sp. MMN_5]|nr:hypothetical protein CN934_32930 [Ensifer sp. MMN_5]